VPRRVGASKPASSLIEHQSTDEAAPYTEGQQHPLEFALRTASLSHAISQIAASQSHQERRIRPGATFATRQRQLLDPADQTQNTRTPPREAELPLASVRPGARRRSERARKRGSWPAGQARWPRICNRASWWGSRSEQGCHQSALTSAVGPPPVRYRFFAGATQGHPINGQHPVAPSR